MRAAVFEAIGSPLAVRDLPDPIPLDDEVLIQVARCGVCGTDLHLTEDHSALAAPGSVLGHEYAGEVVALGRAAEGFKVGDRITALPLRACRQCAACLTGDPVRCAGVAFQFGGFGQFARVQTSSAVRLPQDLSFADAALVEPLAVSLHGVRRANIQPGDSVTVLGAGPIGLGAAFWARRLGAGRITVIERIAKRRAIALHMGADAAIAPDDLEQPHSSDIVIEAVGRPGLLAKAVDHARPGGTILSLGFCMSADAFVPAAASTKGLVMHFTTPWTKRDFEVAADVLAGGAVEPRAMLTETFALADFPTAFEALRQTTDQCKIMVDPWG
ncbi:MAG: alcohol dehydrogenase catalytic domain-containing protein [Caulobacterales bacterium]